MDLTAYLDQQLRAANIPIVGVSVKDPDDRSTWRVQFDPAATDIQKQNAATLIAGVAVDAATLADADLMQWFLSDRKFVALVRWICQKLSIAPAQAKSEIIAIYKALP
jgi:hypothetical protein